MISSGKILILSFIFFYNDFTDIQKADIDLKWHIKTDQRDPDHFIVTVDAGKVNRYIQLSELRFVIDFKDMNGILIHRDTMDFFQKPVNQDAYNTSLYLPGGKISVRTFTHSYGSGARLTGIKLLYKWYDTSISTEIDPFGEKLIFEDTLYGEGSVDFSDKVN